MDWARIFFSISLGMALLGLVWGAITKDSDALTLRMMIAIWAALVAIYLRLS